MDGYARLLSRGMKQGDFAGRNVMLVKNSPGGAPAAEAEAKGGLELPRRIVLIEYNHAIKMKKPSIEETRLPENPAHVFWNTYLSHDFAGWAPLEWEDDYDGSQEQ